MNGMNVTTGKQLFGIAHLRQSIINILTTPLGSRVMRREYGSRLYELVDAPINAQTLVEIYAATAEALIRWEPRLRLTRVRVEHASIGSLVISLEGEYRPRNQAVTLEGIRL